MKRFLVLLLLTINFIAQSQQERAVLRSEVSCQEMKDNYTKAFQGGMYVDPHNSSKNCKFVGDIFDDHSSLVVMKYLSSGCSVDENDAQLKDRCNVTPLMLAARHGNFEDCKKLVDLGADVKLITKSYLSTALTLVLSSHLFFPEGSFDEVEALRKVDLFIKHGADIHHTNITNKTALEKAQEQKLFIIAAYLKSLGA